MQVTLVVGELEREIRADWVTTVEWRTEERPDQPLAEDERELLEELTLLCQRILIEADAPLTGR